MQRLWCYCLSSTWCCRASDNAALKALIARGVHLTQLDLAALEHCAARVTVHAEAE